MTRARLARGLAIVMVIVIGVLYFVGHLKR